MEKNRAEKFQEERERLNQLVFKYSGINVKRFFNLDWQIYKDGTLRAKTKELMGLVASLVLRCDDCILYHLIRCKEEGVTDAELEETVAVGLAVGGSITIPHIRRIWDIWDEMKRES
ncbi:MAG: alkylhydroperoxidase [candidate division Zixibacteria bacterium HGW-Zixibacteria-1]|nr:MAG: alkylhydroperoxidase [candidate division Zixibacteria bacterium HGW-Zixibacteria-1]